MMQPNDQHITGFLLRRIYFSISYSLPSSRHPSAEMAEYKFMRNRPNHTTPRWDEAIFSHAPAKQPASKQGKMLNTDLGAIFGLDAVS